MSCPIASRLLLSCLLPCALLAQDKVRVALYDGPGTSGSIAHVKRALADCADFQVTVLSAEAIAAGGLKGFHVVLHPGGSGGGQGRALGEAGREAERRFLAEGGGYVGICAGAYLATREYPWSLHVLDAKVVDRAHWARGKGAVEVALSSEGQALLGLQAKQQTMAYLQGPLLAPAEDPAVPDFTSLATYATEIAEKGAPKGVMVGTTAVAIGTFQKGRVVCFSPHPERTEAQWPQLHRAVRWAAGAKPAPGKRP